jgi:hypothetical protein
MPAAPPLYLLDGQQRLTTLHRVLTDHVEAQIFDVGTADLGRSELPVGVERPRHMINDRSRCAKA